MAVDVFIRRTAESVHEAGIPDCLNRWANMTPDDLVTLTKLEEQHIMGKVIGPKEAALRASRCRDHRIPKGMSYDEGEAYIAQLAAAKRRASFQRLAESDRIAAHRASHGRAPINAASNHMENTMRRDDETTIAIADETTTAPDAPVKAKATRKAKVLPAKAKAKAAPAKKTAAKNQKTKESSPTKSKHEKKKTGIGATAMAAILAGKSNEDALKVVMSKHPDCSSNVGCMAWYRNKLRSSGQLPK
jgi:hypothetical protein